MVTFKKMFPEGSIRSEQIALLKINDAETISKMMFRTTALNLTRLSAPEFVILCVIMSVTSSYPGEPY